MVEDEQKSLRVQQVNAAGVAGHAWQGLYESLIDVWRRKARPRPSDVEDQRVGFVLALRSVHGLAALPDRTAMDRAPEGAAVRVGGGNGQHGERPNGGYHLGSSLRRWGRSSLRRWGGWRTGWRDWYG